MNVDLSAFAHMTPAEKFQLAQALFEDVAAKLENIPIPQWHLDELDRREEEDAMNPQPSLSWDEVQHRIRARHGR